MKTFNPSPISNRVLIFGLVWLLALTLLMGYLLVSRTSTNTTGPGMINADDAAATCTTLYGNPPDGYKWAFSFSNPCAKTLK